MNTPKLDGRLTKQLERKSSMANQSKERDEKLEAQMQALLSSRQPPTQGLQNQPAAPEPPTIEEPPHVDEPPSAPGLRITANGRKLGKHKDPEWGKFTILLKKQTQKKASRL